MKRADEAIGGATSPIPTGASSVVKRSCSLPNIRSLRPRASGE
jgi:hypothetical protein